MLTNFDDTRVFCQLYISSNDVDPNWISDILGLKGRGFSKGEPAEIGGKHAERAYGTWSYEAFTEDEVPDKMVSEMLDLIAAKIPVFREIVKRSCAKFRVRVHCDGSTRDQIFSLSVPMNKFGQLEEVISDFELVVL
ncbi:hypothetical protein V5F89_10950 [Pelagerythrobacter marensis]|uniref:DUF4279 domain-containing protein n=1 Tax=Pelagerythrobacter marensis TaxID=543877 RepID=A0ABZ2D168_9SPHN